MTSLAVFDFDRTIVNDDSDATIIRKLEEIRTAPEFNSETNNWTPYMGNIFQNAYSAGMRKKDVLAAIASMEPTPGIEELLRLMQARGWHVLILSDANTVFIEHWLEYHKLKDCITDILTNKAYWRGDILCIQPFTHQKSCPRCPENLCKTEALTQWLRTRPPYAHISYTGDGRNDFCPATSLSPQSTVYPRQGYPLQKLIEKTMTSPKPLIRARIVPWSDGYDIIDDLFPGHNTKVKKEPNFQIKF